MKNSAPTAWQPGALPPPRDPATYDRRAGLLRGVATVVMVPLLMIDLFFLGLSPMATDSCGPDHCSAALNRSLATAPVVWLVSAVLFIATWALPARPRFRQARAWTFVAALVSGLMVIAILADLPTG
ncbi:hypothetical protein [Streptomyces sp. C36]|uniref:hypothetical protein n=1 Tax=Streptomyces sp. C36 TaxID=3237122 RepID=UPI0034C5CD3F